jgi:hypothetical protein
MKEYDDAPVLLSVHSVAGEAGEPMTDEQMQQSYQQVMALQGEMKSTPRHEVPSPLAASKVTTK